MSTLRPVNFWKEKVFKVSQHKIDKLHVIDRWSPSVRSVPFFDSLKYHRSNDKERLRRVWLDRIIHLARQDCNIFIELLMDVDWEDEDDYTEGFIKQAWFHREIHRMIDAGIQGVKGSSKHKKNIILLPRGAGKTTQIIGRVIWELGNNPNLRIKLTAESGDIAMQRVYEVKTHIERNPWVSIVFPNLKPENKEKWTSTKLYVNRSRITRDPSFSGTGVLGSATGGRSDLLIGDDVVGRRNSLTQAKLREEVKNTWKSVWMNTLAKNSRAIYIATPWHKDDLTHDIVTKKSWNTFMVTVGQDCETPWLERWSQEELQGILHDLGKAEFDRAFRLIASADNNPPIKEEDLQYIKPELVSENGLVFLLSFDLALGKASGDYFAGTIFAIDIRKKQIYAVDYVNRKIGIIEQIKLITYLCEKWNPNWIVIEGTAYQAVLPEILKITPEMRDWKSIIYTYSPTVNKRLRYEMCSPSIENGRVMFMDFLNPNYIGEKKSLMVKQLVDFGIEAFDDIGDSFAQGVLFINTELKLWSEKTGIKARVLGR